MLLLALAVWASQAVHMSSWAGFFQSTGHLDRTCLSVIEALQKNHIKSPLPLCADSEAGLAMLEQENARILKEKPAAAAGEQAQDDKEAKAREFSVSFLSNVRQELDRLGVTWEQVKPLAFGGVRAKILDPLKMQQPADSVTGELYFLSGDKLIALEMTARRCGANFVVTNFWKFNVLDIPPDKIKDRVAQSIRAFQEEPEVDPNIRIKSPRRVFLSLET